jgi:hypothetical protein
MEACLDILYQKNENYYVIVKDNTVSIYKLDNLFLLRE